MIRFSCLKAAEPLPADIILLTTKSPRIPGTYMIDERMSGPQNREIPLVGKGMENFAEVDLSIGWWESDKE